MWTVKRLVKPVATCNKVVFYMLGLDVHNTKKCNMIVLSYMYVIYIIRIFNINNYIYMYLLNIRELL